MVHSAAGVPLPPGGLVRAGAVPSPAPHQLDRRPRRWRLERPAARRDQPCARRRAVPGRARRVPADVLDALRQPLEDGRDQRGPRQCARASCPPGSCSWRRPTRARAAVVRRARASATRSRRLRYLRRLSGPLLDRFDLRVAVAAARHRRSARRRRRRADGGGRGRGSNGARTRRHRTRRACSTPRCRAAPRPVRTSDASGRSPAARRARTRSASPAAATTASGASPGRSPTSTATPPELRRRRRDVAARARRCATRMRRVERRRGGRVTRRARCRGYVAALAGFRPMTPRRLRILLDHLRRDDAFEVAAGAAAPTPIVAAPAHRRTVAAAWRQSGAERSPAACWERCTRRCGVEVVTAGDPRFPALLRLDPSPPAVLFVRGDLERARRVGGSAIVGTRNATLAGRDDGSDARAAISPTPGSPWSPGLAQGDRWCCPPRRAAAGESAVSDARSRSSATAPTCRTRSRTPTCGARSAPRGVLMSEWPPGTPPEAFRFPMRNRIIAALCEVWWSSRVRERGGSLITVREALERSVDGDGGARLAAQPGCRRHQRADPRRRRAGHVVDDVLARSGSTRGARALLAVRPSAAPRGVDRAVFEPCRDGAANARRGRSGVGSRALPTRRCRWPGSSTRAGSASPADGSRRWGPGPTDHERIPCARMTDSGGGRAGPTIVDGRRRGSVRQRGGSTSSRTSLTSLSANTVGAYAADVRCSPSGSARERQSSTRPTVRPHAGAALCGLPVDAPVRPAQHRPQGGGASPLLPCPSPTAARQADPTVGLQAPAAPTAGCRVCSTAASSASCSTAAPPEGEPSGAAGATTPCSRSCTAAAFACRRAVRSRRSIRSSSTSGVLIGVGQGRQGAAGAARRRRLSMRCGAGWRVRTRGRRPLDDGRRRVFANERGSRLTPRDVRRILDRRSPTPDAPARAAPHLRHASARRRRRPPRRSRSCLATPTWPPPSATLTSAATAPSRLHESPSPSMRTSRRPRPGDALGQRWLQAATARRRRATT